MGLVAENLDGVVVFDRALLKFTLTSAANCMWSAFVTQFIRNTAIIANKVFSLYLRNQRSNIAKKHTGWAKLSDTTLHFCL